MRTKGRMTWAVRLPDETLAMHDIYGARLFDRRDEALRAASLIHGATAISVRHITPKERG